NQNCNKRLKDVFVGAATSGSRRQPFEPLVEKLKQNSMRAEMARLTLARKIAAAALMVWKKGVEFDPKKLNLTSVNSIPPRTTWKSNSPRGSGTMVGD